MRVMAPASYEMPLHRSDADMGPSAAARFAMMMNCAALSSSGARRRSASSSRSRAVSISIRTRLNRYPTLLRGW